MTQADIFFALSWPPPPAFPDLVTEGAAANWAVFSKDRAYRYLLGRRWSDGPLVLWLLTNPSRAGAFDTDHTVTVASEFSRRNSYGGMIFGNLKAFIATHPRDLRAAIENGVDVVGPMNERCLDWALLQTVCNVIAAWGANGSDLQRDTLMLRRLRARGIEPVCLGVTKDGHPRHPARLPYSTPLARLP